MTRRAPLAAGTAVVVLLGTTLPLYREFFEPGQAVWNVLLGLFLVAVAVAAFLLLLFFISHAGEIGEARFDTRNKSDG